MIESDLFKVENLQTIILDEADVLLDFGFDKEILAINDLIKNKISKDLQILCFSATFNQSLTNVLN